MNEARIDHDILLAEAEEIARQAGEYLKEMFYSGFSMKKKGPKDLVTEADYASEKMIIEEIQKRYPLHGIIAEESGESKKTSPYQWTIDPLDGTINFSYGIPFFGVILSVKEKGETIAGVHYMPVLGEMYTACKGKGAYLNGKKISVSDRVHTEELIIGLGDFNCGKTADIQAMGNEKLLRILNHSSAKTLRTKQFGAACIDLAYIASGRTDLLVYSTPTPNPWDVDAGILMIEEAGGKIEVKEGMTIFSNGKAEIDLLRNQKD